MTTAPSSILAGVTRGKVQRPHLVLIYGPDGVGKTTFAAGAPSPIFLTSENGTSNLDVNRLPIADLAGLRGALTELAAVKHDFKTVVLDSLDWFETLVYANVVENWTGKEKITSVDDAGYGKGRVRALEVWKELLPLVTRCVDRGLNFVAIGHALVKKFEDPGTPQGYERYQLKLQSGAGSDVAALWREYVDSVLFTNFKVYTTSDDKRRGFGDGTRVIFTERRPGWDAKNRAGLPFELPLDWDAYASAVAKGEPESVATLKEQVQALRDQVKNKALLPKIDERIKAAADNATELAKLKNKLEATLGAQG